MDIIPKQKQKKKMQQEPVEATDTYVDVYNDREWFNPTMDDNVDKDMSERMKNHIYKSRKEYVESLGGADPLLTTKIKEVIKEREDATEAWRSQSTLNSIRFQDLFEHVHPKLMEAVIYSKIRQEIMIKFNPLMISGKDKLYTLAELKQLCAATGLFWNAEKNEDTITEVTNKMKDSSTPIEVTDVLYLHISTVLKEKAEIMIDDSYNKEMEVTNAYIQKNLNDVMKRYNIRDKSEPAYRVNQSFNRGMDKENDPFYQMEQKKKILEVDLESLNNDTADGIIEDHLNIVLVVKFKMENKILYCNLVTFQFITV